MILKSYEVNKNQTNLLKKQLFLIYGENFGLKKDLKKLLINLKKKQDKDLEIISYLQDEIIKGKDFFLRNRLTVLRKYQIKDT